MNRNDSVLCVCCGREFSVRLLELVRSERPLWCQTCIAYADQELAEAAQRAIRAQAPFVEQE